jgi:hypothetical protein
MLSRFRRADPARTVLGLATDATRAALEEFATGLAIRPRLRLHDTVEELLADRDFAHTPLILVAAEMGLDVVAARGHVGSPCEIAVLCEDPLEHIALRDADAAMVDRRLRIRPVSATRSAVRGTLSGPVSPDRVLRVGVGDGVPIVIAGRAGPLAAHLVLDLLRLLQLPGLAAAIMLAGPGMDALLTRLRRALPELDTCGRVSAQDEVGRLPSRPALMLALADAPDDESLRALDTSGLAPIVRPAAPSWAEIGRAQADPTADHVARAIHGLYLEERQAAGASANDQPSLRPWEDLPERFREASRLQAAHVQLKLRWAGARAGSDGDPAFTWTGSELAALAEAEHRRWASCIRLEGWVHGPIRDDAAKRSPLLAPFATLSAEIQDLDTLPVRAAPRYSGTPVSRDVVVAVSGEAAARAGFAGAIGRTLADMRIRFTSRLVLRIDEPTPLMAALAAAAVASGIPVQLAFPDEPEAPLHPAFAAAERVAVGIATQHLPAVAHRIWIGSDGRIAPAASF